MKNRFFFLSLLVLSFTVSLSPHCHGADEESTLTVRKIVFTRAKDGSERVALSCNRSCVPELSSIEEDNPRVVIDLKGVSLLETKTRTINTGGAFVKKIRSYLDKQTMVLRVVLDMDPARSYLVRPQQGASGKMFLLSIRERRPGERKPGEDRDASGPEPPAPGRIRIERSDDVAAKGRKSVPPTAPHGAERSGQVTAATYLQAVDRGRSQLDAGEFSAAAATFTEAIAAQPQDSLGYRLRGNAYDNLGDRQKAVDDWVQAARRGDSAIQSYLDFLQITWRENPAR